MVVLLGLCPLIYSSTASFFSKPDWWIPWFSNFPFISAFKDKHRNLCFYKQLSANSDRKSQKGRTKLMPEEVAKLLEWCLLVLVEGEHAEVAQWEDKGNSIIWRQLSNSLETKQKWILCLNNPFLYGHLSLRVGTVESLEVFPYKVGHNCFRNRCELAIQCHGKVFSSLEAVHWLEVYPT